MRQRIRSHLTYANVMVTILAFIVLGGGTALASFVISSNGQVGPGTISGHKPPSGDHANIIPGSVNGSDLANHSITKLDIAGADVSGTMNIPAMSPHSCSAQDLGVPGAQVGDVVLLSFEGDTPLPGSVIVEPIKVIGANTVLARECNASGNVTNGVSAIGVRVLTLR